MADHNTNPSNPYFLHSNESPAVVLVTPLLNGKNYHAWARAFKMAIESKNKIKFIDGSLTKPSPDDPLHIPWVRCNNMMLSWIQHSIEGSIVKSILWIDNASQVWKNLKDRYSKGIFDVPSPLSQSLHLINKPAIFLVSKKLCNRNSLLSLSATHGP
ncbi:PREDICTED: uncharacterized protein LOC109328275 [Lupinus angustifolius]|uniref:uncharacterized protein LOC109328275 n=1 Tax=Lupinus angustifolius TaxID=3871 RepID=UPI00092EFDC4|nr:PREDICTED: uncharacterized protein LOC109328275 [Lupinus angustifolius]